MPTAVSPVEVCNLAFDLLRHKDKCTSLTAANLSDTEALAARWYDTTRRSSLRAFPFNFARKRASVPRDTLTPPAFGYSDAYVLPNDYISLLCAGTDADDDYTTDYDVENGQLLINGEGAAVYPIIYCFDNTLVAQWDPIFLDLMTAELAVRFSNSLTGVNKSMKDINSWRRELRAMARSKNGQENPPKVRHVSPIVNARRQLGSLTSYNPTKLFP
jgi:hypothetical protein